MCCKRLARQLKAEGFRCFTVKAFDAGEQVGEVESILRPQDYTPLTPEEREELVRAALANVRPAS